MACEECARLKNNCDIAVQAYEDAVRGTSGLHAWDLNFKNTSQRLEKARHALDVSKAALHGHGSREHC